MTATKISDETERTAPANADMIPLATGGANYKIDIRRLMYGKPQLPFYANADCGLGPLSGGAAANLTLTNQRFFMAPFINPVRKAFTNLAINVVTREAAKGIRIGLYNAAFTSAGIQPSTLIVDAGIVDLDTSTGVLNRNIKSVSGTTLDEGIYFMAALSNGTGTAVISGIATAPLWGGLGVTLSSGGAMTNVSSLRRDTVTYQAFSNYADESGQTYTVTANNHPFFVLN